MKLSKGFSYSNQGLNLFKLNIYAETELELLLAQAIFCIALCDKSTK